MNAGDEGVRAIANYLQGNTTITILDLMDNGVTSLGCEFLAKGIHPAANKCLQKLMLDHNNIGTLGLKNLCQGLALNPCLTDVSLSYCGLDRDSGKSIQLVLAFIDSKIENMNLQGNSLQTEGRFAFHRQV